MKRLSKIAILFALALVCGWASAQTTTTSGTVTDPDGTSWAGGTIAFQLISLSGNTNFYCNGTKLTPAQISVLVLLDNTGSFSQSLTSNTCVTPINTQWSIRICSAASTTCQQLNSTVVQGATQSLTAFISGQLQALRLPATLGARAYTDTEILNPIGGSTYYNLTSNALRLYNGASWVTISTGASSAVTSVANSDSSLTISPTTGAVVASLNVAHSNTFTASQKFNSGITSSANGTMMSLSDATGSQGNFSVNVNQVGSDSNAGIYSAFNNAYLFAGTNSTTNYAGLLMGTSTRHVVFSVPHGAGLGGLTDSADQDTLIIAPTGNTIRIGINATASTLRITGTNVLIPNQKATTGQRYLCIDTSGNLISSASACSGT